MKTETATAAVRVLIADDHTLFRSGLARLLAEDSRLKVVGEAADGAEALEQCEALEPDVVLLDLKMPRVDGVEVTRRIVGSESCAKVLVLTSFDSDPHVVGALGAGASGFVLKDEEPDAIVASILAVHLGGHVMASSVANRMMGTIAGGDDGLASAPAGGASKRWCGLTAREVEILTLIAEGAANKEIAHRLRVSDKTVRNHVSHMYKKLGLSDRSQVVLYAVRSGLVQV